MCFGDAVYNPKIYRNPPATTFFGSIGDNFGVFCLSFMFPCYAMAKSYNHRASLIDLDKDYKCCDDMFCRLGTCPKACFVFELGCALPAAAAVNRYMLVDELKLQVQGTDKCCLLCAIATVLDNTSEDGMGCGFSCGKSICSCCNCSNTPCFVAQNDMEVTRMVRVREERDRRTLELAAVERMQEQERAAQEQARRAAAAARLQNNEANLQQRRAAADARMNADNSWWSGWLSGVTGTPAAPAPPAQPQIAPAVASMTAPVAAAGAAAKGAATGAAASAATAAAGAAGAAKGAARPVAAQVAAAPQPPPLVNRV
jgi:hypothetical protein